MQATWCATLVDEWIRAGVRHAIVAPGSRSTPMAIALADRRELQLDIFHDERSAAFAALGVGLATPMPAVLLCTSGTASAHFLAAVVEADLSSVPMIVLTADRPPELHHVGAPQTIEQDGLYLRCTRWAFNPGVADSATNDGWRSIGARSVLEATGERPGPVHLNLPFREPLVGVAGPLPVGRDSGAPWHQRFGSTTARATVALPSGRGIIVAGYTAGTVLPDDIIALGEATGWPIVADLRSGCRRPHPLVISAFDAILRSPDFVAKAKPDVIVRVGQGPASKVLSQWLATCDAPHIVIDPTNSWPDPDRRAAVILNHLPKLDTGVKKTPKGWAKLWRVADDAAAQSIHNATAKGPLTEIATARWLMASMPSHGNLVVSSSMPIRDVEWFAAPRYDVTTFSNRGANGIDGVLATATGVALASRRPTVVYIGDVATLHDSSSLTALSTRGIDLRIVVSDNDGGAIFSFLPQASVMNTARFEKLFGTPHGTDFAALAAAHHLPYAIVNSPAQLAAQIKKRGPRLIHVRTDRQANVAAHSSVNEAVCAAVSSAIRGVR